MQCIPTKRESVYVCSFFRRFFVETAELILVNLGTEIEMGTRDRDGYRLYNYSVRGRAKPRAKLVLL